MSFIATAGRIAVSYRGIAFCFGKIFSFLQIQPEIWKPAATMSFYTTAVRIVISYRGISGGVTCRFGKIFSFLRIWREISKPGATRSFSAPVVALFWRCSTKIVRSCILSVEKYETSSLPSENFRFRFPRGRGPVQYMIGNGKIREKSKNIFSYHVWTELSPQPCRQEAIVIFHSWIHIRLSIFRQCLVNFVLPKSHVQQGIRPHRCASGSRHLNIVIGLQLSTFEKNTGLLTVSGNDEELCFIANIFRDKIWIG